MKVQKHLLRSAGEIKGQNRKRMESMSNEYKYWAESVFGELNYTVDCKF